MNVKPFFYNFNAGKNYKNISGPVNGLIILKSKHISRASKGKCIFLNTEQTIPIFPFPIF